MSCSWASRDVNREVAIQNRQALGGPLNDDAGLGGHGRQAGFCERERGRRQTAAIRPPIPSHPRADRALGRFESGPAPCAHVKDYMMRGYIVTGVSIDDRSI